MSRESLQADPVYARNLIRSLFSNIPFLTMEDLDVLEFLGNKGFYDDRKAVLIKKDSKLNNLLQEKK